MCLSDRSGSYRVGLEATLTHFHYIFEIYKETWLVWSTIQIYYRQTGLDTNHVTSPENLEDFCYHLTRNINLCRLNLYYSDRNIENMANLFPTNLESQVTGGHTPAPFTWYIAVFFLFFLLAQKKKKKGKKSRLTTSTKRKKYYCDAARRITCKKIK